MIKIAAIAPHTKILENDKMIHGVDYARIVNPMTHLNKQEGFDVDIIYDVREKYKDFKDMAKNGGYDVYYLPYIYGIDYYMKVAFWADKYNIPMVIDIDDNVWETPERSGAYKYFYPGSEHLKTISSILNGTNYITTTNGYLKNKITKRHNFNFNKVTILPNYIDLNVYNYKNIHKKQRDSIRIMYYGTNTHFNDLAGNNGFLNALSKLMAEYPTLEIITAGFFLPEFKEKFKKQYWSLVGEQDIYDWANKLWSKMCGICDFAVAPLLESTFTKSKSNIKYLECSAGKLPMVCQDLPQYRSSMDVGKSGFVAKYEFEWYDKLKTLILFEKTRKEIGNEAYKNIKKNHTIQKHINKYVEYFKQFDNE